MAFPDFLPLILTVNCRMVTHGILFDISLNEFATLEQCNLTIVVLIIHEWCCLRQLAKRRSNVVNCQSSLLLPRFGAAAVGGMSFDRMAELQLATDCRERTINVISTFSLNLLCLSERDFLLCVHILA